MTAISINFRNAAISLAVIGLGLGVAFGIGVAYEKGTSETTASADPSQQLQQLLANRGQASGTPGAGQGAAGQALLGGATTGRITAVDGQTITVQTAQGDVKVNLAPAATINTIEPGQAADLEEGMTVIANGTKKEDGSLDATSISQVPPELQAIATGAGGNRTAPSGGTPPAGATPGPR